MFCYSLTADMARVSNSAVGIQVPEYDEELDNVISLLADLCDVLDESGAVTFCVEGFGQSPWPVDVRTDLLIFLEELPGFVGWMLQNDVPTHVLDFCEQGIERSVTFERQGDGIQLRCDSRMKRKPVPAIEQLTIDKLRTMQHEFWNSFSLLVKVFNPSFASHPWFRAWAATVSLSS